MQANLKYLRKSKKQTQKDVASLVGVARTTWINYEKGTQVPRADTLEKIATIFNISLEELIGRNLSLENWGDRQLGYENTNFTNVALKEGIPLIPLTAKAGYLQGYADPNFIESLPKIYIPEHKHSIFRAFTIEGDSMPPIHSGFIVIGKREEAIAELIHNRRYIFITYSEGIIFKRLAKVETASNQLILSSDNPDFKPFSLHFEEILEIWSFYSFIGYPKDYTSPWMELESRIDRLMGMMNQLNQ